MVDNIEELVEMAFSLNQKEFSHDEIVEKLSSTALVEQTLGLLKLNGLNSKEEVITLASILNHSHSRLRDLSSEVILDFISKNEYLPLFENDEFYKITISAVSDINPNVCRHIISVLGYLQNKKIIFKEIIRSIGLIVEKLDKERFGPKSPGYDKLIFQLFWTLKAIHYLLKNYVFEYDLSSLTKILQSTSKNVDYTVREQSAYVVSVLNANSEEIEILRNLLNEDSNFYVKSAVNSSNVL